MLMAQVVHPRPGQPAPPNSTRCSQLRTPEKQNLPFRPTNQRLSPPHITLISSLAHVDKLLRLHTWVRLKGRGLAQRLLDSVNSGELVRALNRPSLDNRAGARAR